MARDAREVRLCRAVKSVEVAEYDDQAAWPGDPTQRGHGVRQRSPIAVTAEIVFRIPPHRMRHELMDEAQRGLATEFRFHLPVGRAAEYQSAQAVSTVVCSPGQQRCRPTGIDRFIATPGCKVHVGAQIDDDEYRAFAFFAK